MANENVLLKRDCDLLLPGCFFLKLYKSLYVHLQKFQKNNYIFHVKSVPHMENHTKI